ncbi:Cof-type HAD-IIB family hydrolase [Martelella alba]|uniref:HAD family hydrolase n=1 Tax=Martelella alba TaxID=2590451 RepID=A0ABY2SPH3_9HYPH|nr:Cof-type HAD-IIB family hydrolase [Martelella alba]TKI07839.1 HAD family hydrolase [Martelella alba]
MTVKLIAVDMDGTFLDDEKNYNQARFAAQYRALRSRGIRFVVASGNQYYQLRRFFPAIADDIAFVAENGAYVLDGKEQVFCGHLPLSTVFAVLDELEQAGDVHTVVCGKENAWMRRQTPEPIVELMSRHYYRLKRYQDRREIEDNIFKFALTLSDRRIPDLKSHLERVLNGTVTPVTSGFGFVDLIIPGTHKGHGLQLLQARWHIRDDEVVAVGDSGNDREMLARAGYSFAMANAGSDIKRIARYPAGDNNSEAVLDIIDQVLAGAPPFDR